MISRGQNRWIETLESRQLFSGIDQYAGVGYLLSDNGTKLQRYDISAEQWLTPITLANSPGGATASHVDADGIYVAYGASVVRYALDGSTPTHLVNAASNVSEIHSDGKLLFLNYSVSLYAQFISINKQTNTIIGTIQNYVDAVSGSSISTVNNRIFGRSLGVSPADITYVSYDDLGNFTGGGDSPYHGDYPNASSTWVFPQGSKVVDSSGGVYAASSLVRLNSFSTAIDDVTFVGNDIPIVLRSNTLTAYSSVILPTGSKALARPATQILTNGTDVIAFNPVANLANRYDVQIVPLSALAAPQPGQPVNPTGLAYTPDDIETTGDGTLLILDIQTQSIFRWNSATKQYGATIPLVDVPKFMAYSEESHAVYLAYASGLIDRINLDAGTLTETPFAVLPSTPLGLSTAGKYVFAVDGSGAWDSHYTFAPDGTALSAVDWNYYSSEYIWSPAKSKMYFFRDDTSPNDLLSEDIGLDGRIGAYRDSPLHDSAGFTHPIRVSPDGATVILGSGRVHNAETLVRLAGGLGNSVSDIAWLNGTVYTVRSIAGNAQFQQWLGSTYAPGVVTQYQGAPQRLLTVGDRLVGIYTPASGVPQFLVMDGNLRTDWTAPTVQSGVYTPNDRRITLTASEALAASSTHATIAVLPNGSAQDVGVGSIAGNTVSFTLPASVVDGNYTLRVPAGAIRDAAGNPIAADYEFECFVLGADANRDRCVDANDLGILSANWQGTSKTFSQGDFNYDGRVDISDLYILSSKWQQTLAPPAPPAVLISTTPPRRAPIRVATSVLT